MVVNPAGMMTKREAFALTASAVAPAAAATAQTVYPAVGNAAALNAETSDVIIDLLTFLFCRHSYLYL